MWRVDQGKGNKDRTRVLAPASTGCSPVVSAAWRPRTFTRQPTGSTNRAGSTRCGIATPPGSSRPGSSSTSFSAGSGTAPSARPCATCIWPTTRHRPRRPLWTCWSSRGPASPDRCLMPVVPHRPPGRRWRSRTSCAREPMPTVSTHRLSPSQKVVDALVNCRTAVLGGFKAHCDHSGRRRSICCRNRQGQTLANQMGRASMRRSARHRRQPCPTTLAQGNPARALQGRIPC